MLRRLQFIALRILILFFVVSIFWVLVLKFLPVWVTPFMLSRKMEAFRADEDTEIHHD